MRAKKGITVVIFILIITTLVSGCIFDLRDERDEISIKYRVNLINTTGKKYNVSIPTLILGNRYYNTPRNLDPIFDINDYETSRGYADLNYIELENSTLLNISSTSKNVTVELSKDGLDYDKYSEYKGEKGGDDMLYPFLNSYYKTNKTEKGLSYDKIGLIYSGEVELKISVHYEILVEDGEEYIMNGDFQIIEEGFHLKEIMTSFDEPPP